MNTTCDTIERCFDFTPDGCLTNVSEFRLRLVMLRNDEHNEG